jgi:prephenate dehydrogenase
VRCTSWLISEVDEHVTQLGTVGVVGAGLIGTSIGMALTAAGVDVVLRDRDLEQARVAAARKAGRLWENGEQVSHAVIAVPPHEVARVLRIIQRGGYAATTSDVSSVKGQIVAEAVELGCDLTTFCPAHPIAGRERGGAVSAQVDLFRERTWALCPVPETGAAASDAARAVALTCGASVIMVDPLRHDEVMARLSHFPQVVASALAAEATEGLGSDELALAGSGLRDTTRLADSDARLWASILEGNRRPVADGIDRLIAGLGTLSAKLRNGTAQEVSVAVEALFAAGRLGRSKMPTKAGQPIPDWHWVAVVVPDRPGMLARLFDVVGDWGVNIEDVRVEHSQAQAQGLAELAVRPAEVDQLVARLQQAGWRAYQLE